jgi:mRNA interferase YafQ
MLDIVQTSIFKKDLKRLRKRGFDLTELAKAVELLRSKKPLPKAYMAHPLSGERKGQWDLHIQSDWVLLYRIEAELALLRLERTGTHSDLGL